MHRSIHSCTTMIPFLIHHASNAPFLPFMHNLRSFPIMHNLSRDAPSPHAPSVPLILFMNPFHAPQYTIPSHTPPFPSCTGLMEIHHPVPLCTILNPPNHHGASHSYVKLSHNAPSFPNIPSFPSYTTIPHHAPSYS